MLRRWPTRGELVRIHLRDTDHSYEGVLLGRVAGHYVLIAPKIIEAEDRATALEGRVEIPAEHVEIIQVPSA